MTMNLPTIASDYMWKIEDHLRAEDLNRDEVRVAIVSRPHGILRRRRVLYVKTVHLKDTAKREEKIERTAKKLYKKYQAETYRQNEDAYARYLAAENMRQARLNRNQLG